MANDSESIELLPCPLCNGEVDIALHGDEFDWYWWTIQRGTNDATACKCRLFVESDAKFTLDSEDAWDDPHAQEILSRLVEKWNTRAEQTCRNDSLKKNSGVFVCSECGVYLDIADMDWDGEDDSGGFYEPRFCPNCRAKVVNE